MEFIHTKNRVYVLDSNGKEIAYVNFPEIEPGVVEIKTTKVDESLRGQGVAAQLMEHAYQVIKENGCKAKLTCEYAINWYKKHEDKQDILQ